MASADYLKCEICGGKAVYDGNWNIRDQDNEVAALCIDCSETHTLKPVTKAEQVPGMIWNHDISTAPRDGSQFLMATTDGKRFLTRWLEPTKGTPAGRFDGFPEKSKTLLAWCGVLGHPFAAATRGEAAAPAPTDVSLPVDERSGEGANAGGGHVTDGENAQPVSAGGAIVTSAPAFILDDCGSGA